MIKKARNALSKINEEEKQESLMERTISKIEFATKPDKASWIEYSIRESEGGSFVGIKQIHSKWIIKEREIGGTGEGKTCRTLEQNSYRVSASARSRSFTSESVGEFRERVKIQAIKCFP